MAVIGGFARVHGARSLRRPHPASPSPPSPRARRRRRRTSWARRGSRHGSSASSSSSSSARRFSGSWLTSGRALLTEPASLKPWTTAPDGSRRLSARARGCRCSTPAAPCLQCRLDLASEGAPANSRWRKSFDSSRLLNSFLECIFERHSLPIVSESPRACGAMRARRANRGAIVGDLFARRVATVAMSSR